MNEALKDTIEDIYRVFGDTPKPTHIDGCSHCIEEKGIEILLAKPLRSLTPSELTEYAASVFLTVGSVGDFFYFLPRILEILVAKPGWWPHPEVVARAMCMSEFHTWPASRRDAVQHYFDAVLEDLLITDDSGWMIDEWICALGGLVTDITPFLARISTHPKRLIEYYEVNSNQLIKGHLMNGFWDDKPETSKQVVDWFNSPAIRNLIEVAYFGESGG